MSLKDRPWFPIAYMFTVTTVMCGALIALNGATRELVKRNERLFRERAVVAALGLAPQVAPAGEIHELYERRIRLVKVNPAGGEEDENIAEFQLLGQDGRSLAGYGVPIIGRGYWDIIRGIVGVGPDRRTLLGLAFYQQNETPGLGAEIAAEPFRSQFVGKLLNTERTPIEFRPPSAPVDEGSVHAITGATQTSTRLALLMNEDLRRWLAGAAPTAGAPDGMPKESEAGQ